MTTNVFYKPEIKFPMFPFIYAYIEAAYNKVTTYDEYVSFIHGCMNEAETTKNKVKKRALDSISKSLFSIETGFSFESKAIELMVEKL